MSKKHIKWCNLVWFTNQFRISFPLNFLNKFLIETLVVPMERKMTILRWSHIIYKKDMNIKKTLSEIQPNKD